MSQGYAWRKSAPRRAVASNCVSGAALLYCGAIAAASILHREACRSETSGVSHVSCHTRLDSLCACRCRVSVTLSNRKAGLAPRMTRSCSSASFTATALPPAWRISLLTPYTWANTLSLFRCRHHAFIRGWCHQLCQHRVSRFMEMTCDPLVTAAKDSCSSRTLLRSRTCRPEDLREVFLPSEFNVPRRLWSGRGPACRLVKRLHFAFFLLTLARCNTCLESLRFSPDAVDSLAFHSKKSQFVGDDGGFHHSLEPIRLRPQRTRKVEGSSGFTRPLLVHSIRPSIACEVPLVIFGCKFRWFRSHPCCKVTLHFRKPSTLTSLVRKSPQRCNDFHCAPGAM